MQNEATNTAGRWRTILIERENLLRTMLARLVLLSERFRLEADFGDVLPARDACFRLKPELVVIDVDFPSVESVELIEILTRELPRTRVLALSGSEDPRLWQRLRRAKVHGYVARDEPVEILEEAMLEVAAGHSYLPAAFLRPPREPAIDCVPLPPRLTEQERTILRRVARGQTSRAIAFELRLSPRSVETYRGRILRKLGVPNTAALVDYAARHGMVAAEDLAGPAAETGVGRRGAADAAGLPESLNSPADLARVS